MVTMFTSQFTVLAFSFLLISTKHKVQLTRGNAIFGHKPKYVGTFLTDVGFYLENFRITKVVPINTEGMSVPKFMKIQSNIS